MNPNETFIPRGVPYNPRSAAPPMAQVVAVTGGALPPAPPPPPPPEATIVIDETDHLGITTVMIYKHKAESDLGIRLKHVPYTGLVLDEFANTGACRSGILVSTKLHPTMNVLSINGCDCSGMTVPEAMLMISSTVGELTIKAVHSQVLMWPGTEPQPTLPTETTSSNTNNATPPVDSNDNLALVPVNQSTTSNNSSTEASTPTPASKQPQQQQYPMVKAVIQKSSKRSSVGFSVGNEIVGTTTFPVITRIDPEGLASNTPLQVGMRIWSVNGLRCYNKDDTNTKLKRAKATCYIEAQQLADTNNNDDNNLHALEERGEGKGRRMIRSMSPKKWLPSFHRNSNHHNNKELVRAENGEST